MVFTCDICGIGFRLHRNLRQHRRERHEASLPSPGSTDFVTERDGVLLEQHQLALRGYLRSYVVRKPSSSQDPSIFLNNSTNLLSELIHQLLTEWTGLKAFLSLKVVFSRSTDDTDTIRSHFNSSQREILTATDVIGELEAAFGQITLRIEEFLDNGSDWVIVEISHLDIHLARYKALRGGSTYVPLPPKLGGKHAVINVHNNDTKCFMWSVLSALHPVHKDAQRLRQYRRFESELDFDGLTFPIKVRDIGKFEHLNNIGISLFSWENDDVIPMRICKTTFAVIIDLLLIDGHYCWIKNLDALLADQRKTRSKNYFCRRCLLPQYSEQKLLSHYELCRKNEPTKLIMPDAEFLKFNNFHRMQRAPYVIYCDFEALLLKMDHCLPSPLKSHTTKYQHHQPCSFGIIDMFGCCGDKIEIGNYFSYRGENAVMVFLRKIIELTELHSRRPLHPKPKLSNEDWRKFNSADSCYLCDKTFQGSEKVRDHCHYCSRYRGAAHYDCNMQYRLQNKVQVVFHNLKRYDGHLIMQEIGALSNQLGLELNCIAKGMEEYVSLSLKKRKEKRSIRTMPTKRRKPKRNRRSEFILDEASDSGSDVSADEESPQDGCDATDTATEDSTVSSKQDEWGWSIVFIDSLQFLPSSLDVLVGNLQQKGSESFCVMQHFFGADTGLLLRKGIYPYEYMDSWERFNENVLPSKEAFNSSLLETVVSDSDYAHAATVWEHFGLPDLGHYHDIYLKTDVLLLCDVFENFRCFSTEHYGLDPAHYYTLPSLGWDACLKLTEVRLDLLQDADMYQFFEAGIRGGISMITHRYGKANNKYVPNFDPTKTTNYLIYLDMNNLYGTTMIRQLPVREFHWMSRDDIESMNWLDQTDEQSTGYVLEVDLDYPSHLHTTHGDYPLAPERLKIMDSMLSPYCRELKDSLGCISGTMEKLVPNLQNKRHYILHYCNLRLYLQLGMTLQHVHRAIRFDQADWMAAYINFNTEMRKKATTDFEKDLFKLLNNAVFGKTMENVRNYKDVQLVVDPAKFQKLVANPRYQSSVIFIENLVAVSMAKRAVELCKPIYAGFSVLELSKVYMYNFHYNHIVPKYGEKAKLCLTDTDSFIYNVECDDIYADMQADQDLFDTSNYPEDNPLHSNRNKKVLGKMKDETAGVPIEEFVGLRPKMYSLVYDGTEKKRAKGVKKRTVSKLRHLHYRETLLRKHCRHDIMRMINSDRHQLYTMQQNKISLSPFDDKRYILSDGVTTLAYGDVNIAE